MTIADFVGYLRTLDVDLSADGDRLRATAPEGVLTSDLRSELLSRKPEILALLRGADRASPSSKRPLAAVSRDQPAPLSYAQEALWFLDQLLPKKHLYNLPLGFRLRGRLDVTALRHALDELARRHPALRTAFIEDNGRPAQVVRPPAPAALPMVDLRDRPEAEREQALRLHASHFLKQPFDLRSGQPLRAALIRLADDDHALVLVMHHIVSDEWSTGILARDLGRFYSAFAAGADTPPPAASIQYADYAIWQREHLDSGRFDDLLAYWRAQLAGSDGVLDLPTDRPRPPVPSYSGNKEQLALSADLSDAVRTLARREGATLFMTLLAAFYVLLQRYSGQCDITSGAPIAGRSLLDLHDVVGYFINTLVLRIDLSGDPTFRELMKRVREVCLGAYAHQELPFEKLVEARQPQRDLSRNPLYQVMFDVQQTAGPDVAIPHLEATLLDIDSETGKFDLTLAVAAAGRAFRLQLDYATDLFDAETIRRMLRHYATLLESIVADPDERISRLDLLPAAERRQLLVEWNATSVAFPNDPTIHQLVEEQVERTPDAVAIVCGHASLTYRELNERANQLAHHLRRRGIGAESIVGIYATRSLEMGIAVLATLKAGAAYVPLDPEYPRERVAFMIADANLRLILTLESVAGALAPSSVPVVCVDRDWDAVACESRENPAAGVAAGNLAYVIYTSGSTGTPKGVAIPHGGLVNHLRWMQRTFPLTAADRVLQKNVFSFDASVWEFYTPLVAGARLVMAGPEAHHDPVQVSAEIRRHGVTVTLIIPSLLRMLLEEPLFASCTSLRRVFCGGEALAPELLRRLTAMHAADVHNLYGPTEGTIAATSWACGREAGDAAVPIGTPIANTHLRILDPWQQPVPAGVTGELYIGGAGLARGYLHQPAITAARFVPDPFGAPGARMYRTGDRARYRPDGAVEYAGRVDHQVKLRGYRLEPGEIESVLRQHPLVRDAVVVVHDEPVAGARLIAYVVSKAEALADADLRALAKSKLPAYMVPAVFVALDALSLTPSGKIDRRALPAPARPLARSAAAPLDSRLERSLAALWQQLLGVDRIGANDNFFDLGGHSLLLIEMRSALGKSLGREVSITELFRHPTVRSLAEYLNNGDDETAYDEVVHRAKLQRSAMNRQRQIASARQAAL
jgi:amino acid adenylation domain-containing protein